MKKNDKPILWLGNGLNRTFEGDSWEKIIRQVCHKNKNPMIVHENIKKIPYNLQIVAATDDCIDVQMKELAEKMRNTEFSDELYKFIRENLLSLPFEDIITTNYTYELEKTLDLNYSTHYSNRARKKIIDGNTRQNQFMIYRYNELAQKKIWHIHGEACTPSSVIMGNYYYGKLLYTIQEYLSKRMGVLKHCYKENLAIKNPNYIDLFLTRDVYVAGFGLDFSEVDFWWLVCCKKRNFPDTNIYIYEPNLSEDNPRKIVGESYGISFRESQSVNKGEYKKYWERIVDQMRRQLV